MFNGRFLFFFSMFFSIVSHLSFFLFLILSDKSSTFDFAVEVIAGFSNIGPK